MPKLVPHFVRSIAETILSASDGDSEVARATADAVIAYIKAPKHLSVVFFSFPPPIDTLRVYAVSSLSGEVLATQRVEANETAKLRNIIHQHKACSHIVQLEFEALDSEQRVFATAAATPLDQFLKGNELELQAPLPNFQVDCIPVQYSAMLES
jgi:hypothetical protein